jgi:hypothetical protein
MHPGCNISLSQLNAEELISSMRPARRAFALPAPYFGEQELDLRWALEILDRELGIKRFPVELRHSCWW